MKKQPMMYVLAGNNRSGKRTYRGLLIDKLGNHKQLIKITPIALIHTFYKTCFSFLPTSWFKSYRYCSSSIETTFL